MYVYMYIRIYVYMYICIYVYMYICIYVHMYICIYAYMYICIYVYMYMKNYSILYTLHLAKHNLTYDIATAYKFCLLCLAMYIHRVPASMARKQIPF